jgi:hypothetical protein
MSVPTDAEEGPGSLLTAHFLQKTTETAAVKLKTFLRYPEVVFGANHFLFQAKREFPRWLTVLIAPPGIIALTQILSRLIIGADLSSILFIPSFLITCLISAAQ